MTATAHLDAIEARAKGLTDLCPEHLRQSIRHVQRNCDIDCNVHEDEPTWDDCKQPDRYDGDRMADALADIPHLLTLARKQHAALEAGEALHKPVKKWEPYEGAGYTFATREEALRAGGEEDLGIVAIEAGPQFFEVCAECGRVESEQLVESGEDWGYRESLWPCKTIEAIRAALGDSL